MAQPEDRRFTGISRLFGLDGAEQIADAHVVVVGIGGVGSWAAEALARSGVGHLTLVDLDHVAVSNINRQIHAVDNTLGMAKVLAMQQRIHAFFPQCRLTCVDDFVSADNWPGLLSEPFDALIDACDQLPAKVAMAHWALSQKAIFVSVGAAGGKRMAQAATIADLAQVTHDPLLAKVRYQLRREHGARRDGKAIGIDCVFSHESVAPPHASCATETDGSLNCSGFGSAVAVTATFGLCAAGHVLNKLALPKPNRA